MSKTYRRPNRDEVHQLCQVCNDTYIVAAADPFPARTCNNPCIDAIEIVRDAKNDLSFTFESTNDGSGYDWALRILKRVKEAA